MGMIIAVLNQKGGCGKTTTTDTVSDMLARSGYSVLDIELDPQGNLGLLHGCKDDRNCLYTLLKGGAFQPIRIRENHHLIPAGNTSRDIPTEYAACIGKEVMLADILESYRDMYDFIFLDCPPTLSLLTDLAMAAADKLLVPVSIDLYSIDGLTRLDERTKLIKRFYNPGLDYLGLLVTNAKKNAKCTKKIKEMAQEATQYLGTKVFTTIIRNSIVVSDAQVAFKTLQNYRKNASVTKDYAAFTDELLETIQYG